MIHDFTDNWENVQNFQARPDEILIATYPKAGTIWVSYILDLFYFGNVAPERQTRIPISLRVPFLELFFAEGMLSGVDLADKLPTKPRLIKTHLPIQLVPKSFWEQNCKGCLDLGMIMKNNKMANYSTSPVMDFMISPFMRKGKVGDWKNHFTVAQNEQFDEHYKKKMKNTTLQSSIPAYTSYSY